MFCRSSSLFDPFRICQDLFVGTKLDPDKQVQVLYRALEFSTVQLPKCQKILDSELFAQSWIFRVYIYANGKKSGKDEYN
jgi:hypothetical protein